ncbi:MAG: carboxypeptidase-like regulatory domain-containing protein [Acidobacteriota bacterium]
MKLTILAVVILTSVRAQTLKEELLPQVRHVSGLVVDQSGHPITGAQVDHTGAGFMSIQTGASGEFDVYTRAPAFVIRKGGYESAFVRTPEDGEIRLTLQPSPYATGFPACSSTQKYESLKAGQFKFPRLDGVKANQTGRDVDYLARTYSSGKSSITHGAGPSWSKGLPSDSDVWHSIRYQETVRYDQVIVDSVAYFVLITDARGEDRGGMRWRYLGEFGESASYHGVSAKASVLLDRFMDGWCVAR